jgi:hypothetical protein
MSGKLTKAPRDQGCLCGGCGRRYRVDLLLPDTLWAATNSAGAEMLCGCCIVQRLETLGFGAYRLYVATGRRSGGKPTKAQISALKTVERRDWPAGEPRLGWIGMATAAVLLGRGLIAKREGSEKDDAPGRWRASPIVDLTPAGLQALQENRGG